MQCGECNTFLILPKYNSMQVLQKKYVKLHEMVIWNGRENLKFTFLTAIAVSLFKLQLQFDCNLALHFSFGRKLF